MINTKEKYKNSRIAAIPKSVLCILLFIGLLVVSGNARQLFPPQYSLLFYGILGSLAGLLTVRIFLKIDKASFASIGLVWEKNTLARFITGVITGTLIFLLMMAALLRFSELTIGYNPEKFDTGAIFIYLPVLPLALMEEIGFRSYPQIKIKRAYGVWASQLILAILFGAYHILNGWSVYSSFAGPFVWAFVFGLAALWSRGIAVPTGIHFALNIMQHLVGMKGNKGSVWVLAHPAGTNSNVLEQTDKTGLLLQVAVLFFALLATGYYIKKTTLLRKD